MAASKKLFVLAVNSAVDLKSQVVNKIQWAASMTVAHSMLDSMGLIKLEILIESCSVVTSDSSTAFNMV